MYVIIKVGVIPAINDIYFQHIPISPTSDALGQWMSPIWAPKGLHLSQMFTFEKIHNLLDTQFWTSRAKSAKESIPDG